MRLISSSVTKQSTLPFIFYSCLAPQPGSARARAGEGENHPGGGHSIALSVSVAPEPEEEARRAASARNAGSRGSGCRSEALSHLVVKTNCEVSRERISILGRDREGKRHK